MFQIDQQLRSATGISNKVFGNIHDIFLGDLYQLDPVCDALIYRESNNNVKETQGSMCYFNIDLFINLTIMKRQNEDEITFREILSRMRTGKSISADIDFLNRKIQSSFESVGIQNLPADTLYITPTKKEVDKVNEACTRSL